MKKKTDYVQVIKERVNLVEILSNDLKLIKSGSNYKALCPFHEEKTPSFTINVAKQNYVCYGCGKSGDVFSYIMEKYKITFREALEKIAKDFNISLDNNYISQNINSKKNSQYYYKVMNEIASYYSSILKQHLVNNNINFLDKKKITLEKIE
ncbi:MAG: CHC2 zinc finger domain-containing protein, partial [Pseudomonadota bacterium]|nr:CHC2 zinc finger domain-containing protein [Pseudomonadota bacterium]